MTTTRTRPTHAEVMLLADLNALLEGARALRDRARSESMPRTAKQLNDVARTLDGARTCLVQDGADYLDAAEAFRDAAERSLLDAACRIGGVVDARP